MSVAQGKSGGVGKVPFWESTCSVGGKMCRCSFGVEEREMMVEDGDDTQMLIPPQEEQA